MASVSVLPPPHGAIGAPLSRGNARKLLSANELGSNFHVMFDTSELKKKEKSKPKKKGKAKSKDKAKAKREKSPDNSDNALQQPVVETHGNASAFTVYSSIRQVVQEHQIKQVSEVYALAYQGTKMGAESDDDDGEDDTNKDNVIKMPKIVSLGMCGVFELIRETRSSHPELCTRALHALLDMLQGQHPEGLRAEPQEVIDSLYTLLMELATSPSLPPSGLPLPPSSPAPESQSLTALACSCLLSLVVARGDTGKVLAAAAALLMSPANLSSQEIKTPLILTSLQKSVQAVLLGKTCPPDWLSKGLPENAKMAAETITELAPLTDPGHCTIAADGKYIYIHNTQGLHKVGSGYGDTVRGHVYNSNPDFHTEEAGWLAYANNTLFFKSKSASDNRLAVINKEKLHQEEFFHVEGDSYGPNVMFSDGENLGHVASSKDDSFVVRSFSPICSPMPLVSELPLKLARKCLDVFGMSWFDAEMKIHSINLGVEEDVASIIGGKDFALTRTPTGKVLYTGRSQSLGIKQGGPGPDKWAELPIIKSPKIVQCSVGHEASHALLVAEDGAVFFVGTSKRGEDGDGSVAKARRQPKPQKPRKMIKVEGKTVVYSACNSGTSALVTRDGELFMYGKDKTHADGNTGLVTELRDVQITSVALGKAHAIALTKTGQVYSFGINNKGQCGRDYVAGATREPSTPVTMADEEEDLEDDPYCAPGKHKWTTEVCMVCVMCNQCTGYGSSCISSDAERGESGARIPCGCGSGDSGCSVCGICRACARVEQDDKEALAGDGPNNHALLEMLARSGGDMLPFDVILGRHGAKNMDQLNKKFEKQRAAAIVKSYKSKLKGAKGAQAEAANPSPSPSPAAGPSNNAGSDYEQDHVKTTSLPPGLVHLGNSDATATMIACGQQHTVVLLATGEVYTFGSNQYGQLGHGDTVTKGTPTKVQLKSTITQIAAGSHHTVLLTSNGQVLSFGSHQKGQLGREAPDDDKVKDKKGAWFSVPGLVPGIGAKHGRRAAWIGAGGDQTYLRIDELLINAHTLNKSTIVANPGCIGLITTGDRSHANAAMSCLMISRGDGSCRSYGLEGQMADAGQAVCLDPVYDVLWSYEPVTQEISCCSVIHSEARTLSPASSRFCNILRPELAVPVRANTLSTRSHAALFMLGCLDTLTAAQELAMTIVEEEKERTAATKVYTKEDYSIVNRFESHGGGWGYSGHSIEAIRFMADTDILLGGLGLFGGRGDYFGKIKLLELGPDGGDNETDGDLLAETDEIPYECGARELGPDGRDNETDGDLLAETDEIPYECGAREKYAILFEEPVPLQAGHWYVTWARISGPSSDCGSSGQPMVTTEDQVVFKFRSSKKSNNGTDVNAGQIPQLLYRLPSHDSMTSTRKNDSVEPAHVLSRDFSRTVSPEGFTALLKLLGWSWRTFCLLLGEVSALQGGNQSAAELDLERLVYISTAALRLLRIYVCEVYPRQGVTKKTPAESTKLAECVGDSRALLKKILAESPLPLRKDAATKPRARLHKLAAKVLDECHDTLTACYHAFYPLGTLKWNCLCELLGIVDPSQPSVEGYGRLLAAVMEALCHPTVKLTAVMPINCEYGTEQLLKQQFGGEDNTNSAALSGDISQYPMLVSHMVHRGDTEGGTAPGHHSFREILDRLLTLVVLPVRQALNEEKQTLPSSLVSNTCSLLSALLSELAASATGSEIDLTGTTRPMLTTPNRFTRTSQSPYWNTGNGSPDAVGFSVDRSGVVIAGVCVYGTSGGGHYDYEVELLNDTETSSDPSHTGRWSTLETVKGNFGPEDCMNDIAEIKFDRPVPIKENMKYAIRLKNRGPRTLNGDAGLGKVKCPDGTTFIFTVCSLSTNGTNHTRGQIPQILYYSAPQDGENSVQNSKALAEYQARKNAISITSAIFRASCDLLHRAQGTHMECLADTLGSCDMFSTLLPMCMAYIGPVAVMDPRGAVHVLSLIQEILPAMADLSSQLFPQSLVPSPNALSLEASEGNTTSQHYAIVESDHPYKPATVANYRVTFPGSVRWLVLEFDAQCGTSQVEDSLQLYIPTRHAPHAPSWATNGDAGTDNWWAVYKRFSGSASWPTLSLILPGNEVCFSLETASDYVKDDKGSTYGFKCTVVGYEWAATPQDGLLLLEREASYLGGLCASSLMKKDIVLPPATVDEMEEDMELVEEGAQQVFSAHSSLLGKGFALAHSPSITQALEGNLPFSWSSNERAFLKDFVNCTMGTSGGRLAAWLQPESYLDPKHCHIECNKEELQCSWPCVLTVHTRDQYKRPVHVANLKLEVKAIPIIKDVTAEERRSKRLSRCDGDTGVTFGGHPPPKLDVPYSVTVKDKKDAFHSICMMKTYDNYSFEELRYAAPVMRRPSENMLVRSNEDGTFSANWTPSSTGWYKIQVLFDGYEAGEALKVKVKEPSHGAVPPTHGHNKKQTHQPNKMRKFVGQWSAGLRVRINPSLQSEQIGIIKPEGIISFVDEIHNNDGVWIRLSKESMQQWCPSVNGYGEAWALQYHQHLGKTLLVPLEQPKSLLDELIKDAIMKRRGSGEDKQRRGGPGCYHVVKCGSSGHNIRCRPNLKATPVGMVVLGNQFIATEEVTNSDGTWLRLDRSSAQRYCTDGGVGEAWTLAVGTEGLTFLAHESEIGADEDHQQDGLAASTGTGATKGFDFTAAQQIPSFSAFGAASGHAPAFGLGFGAGASGRSDQGRGGSGVITSGFGTFPPQPSTSSVPTVLTFGKLPPSSSRPASGESRTKHQRSASSGTDRTVSRDILDLTLGRCDPDPPTAPPPRVPQRHDSLMYDLPPELQGVSVKDLVKALGKVKVERGLTRALGGLSRTDRNYALTTSAKTESPRTGIKPKSTITAELLKGISIKELVRVLGESRVNGNGVTPPRTPPGTPKKTPSRSSSPRPSLVGLDSRPLSPRLSPRLDDHRRSPLSSPRATPRSTPRTTPPCTPPLGRRLSAGAATPPNTPPLLRRDFRASPPGTLRRDYGSSPPGTLRRDYGSSPPPTLRRLGVSPPSTLARDRSTSPTSLLRRELAASPQLSAHRRQRSDGSLGGSPRRSHSVSPQRPHSPLVIPPRVSSASPIRSQGGAAALRSQSPGGSSSGGEGALKGHFSIGTSSPKEDIRMSPKSSRKDRTKVLRTRRERGSPPPSRDGTLTMPKARSRSGSLQIEHTKVQEAMSPSVAQCTRAVFAAFMWHEGIVHDAMACASYLKFHPNLPKEVPKLPTSKTSSMERNKSGKSTPSGSLKRHGKHTSLVKDTANININEAVKKLEQSTAKKIENMKAKAESSKTPKADGDGEASKQELQVRPKVLSRNKDSPKGNRERAGTVPKERHNSEGKDVDPSASSRDGEDSKLPPTLRHLVYFWQELAAAASQVISQNLILPSPGLAPLLRRSDKKDKDKDKDKKGKKKDKPVVGGRGNLFGEAAMIFGGGPGIPAGAAGAGGGERETKCELCGGMYPHPVTYHMKEAHPGCGKHAKGQGYNSGGNYCPGWAGNCGDGGKGGSTWYLMCEQCRDKYLKEKQQLLKDKAKKSKKKNTPVKQVAPVQIQDPHIVMKNNAMFLLDLASAAGLSLPAQGPRSPTKRPASGILPSVTEDFSENSPFAPTPFLFLAQHGAQAADSAFAEELVFSDDGYHTNKPRPKGLSQSSQFEAGNVETGPGRICRSGSVSGERQMVLSPLEEKSRSAEVSPCEEAANHRPGLLLRSVSEITKRTGQEVDDDDDDEDEGVNGGPEVRGQRVMAGRRRNNSGGLADGGNRLLKHLSASMTRLIQTATKQAQGPGSQGSGSPLDKTFLRPVLQFVVQRHDLECITLGMKQALRKVTCRVFALQAYNWLLRSVSQPMCLHDLLWSFVAALTPPQGDTEDDDDGDDKRKHNKKEQDQDAPVCEHPLSDIAIAGQAVRPLQETFHTYLQTISDVMMYLPPGSALQQMAVRCFCLAFRPSDHLFLHKCHVFSNISKILSKSDEGWGANGDNNKVPSPVSYLRDVTPHVDIKTSSRQAMTASLTDNSTETFWESGDDDRNKTKTFTISCEKNVRPKMVAVHVDNSRDIANKVTLITFAAGAAVEDLRRLRISDLELRHSGWVVCELTEPRVAIIRLEMKGPDNTLRLRQIKVLGAMDGAEDEPARQLSPLSMQQRNCEAETLKVFRLLTAEVFGKLISDIPTSPGDEKSPGADKPRDEADAAKPGPSEADPARPGEADPVSRAQDAPETPNDGELDLKEHMVSILFSRSKLTHLQKQVCAHIVQAIRKETIRVQEEWEDQLQSPEAAGLDMNKSSDVYCFELLSMVLALSGSVVGRSYLAKQHSLLQDMLSLMHTSTPRVQRQVLALLRRVLPEVPPKTLAGLLGIDCLPPQDLCILSADSDAPATPYDVHRQRIIDVFLAAIAKAMTVQMKGRGQGKAAANTFRLRDNMPANSVSPNRWWLRGTSSPQMAEATILLLKDLASGKFSEAWSVVTKSAVAENILALTKLDESLRDATECTKTPTLWLALASLCVLEQEHVERLSSGQWRRSGEPNTQRPTCDNHDDGETVAIILCSECGNLCGDCDRFLHLHRRTRSHTRQVFKEEKEAIKVDLHEGCGRTKLFWIMALADSRTLKAVVDFRESAKGKYLDSPSSTGGPVGTCRFCGATATTGLLALGNVCSAPDCQDLARSACTRALPCGHPCGGIADEEPCLPCLYGCVSAGTQPLKQDADDMCMVCFTEALSGAPAIQLKCGHVFHLHCCRNVLDKRWVGPRITFGFSLCPICKTSIDHAVLSDLLTPIRRLYDDVKRKAMMRLEYEGLHKTDAITTHGTRFHNDPTGFAMDRYAYYVCYKCHKAYYGGEARCEEQAANPEDYDPSELVCGACSDVSRAQMCPKHGTDFLEYKCRYCCSVAVFFCFGTTHFCNACHDDFQRVTNISKTDLPHCPAGPKARQLDGEECPLHVQHPPTGEEFALGCGVCRNAHTF